jgi:subtilisin family serine protease
MGGNYMKNLKTLTLAGLLTALFTIPSFADDNYIVRLKSSAINSVAQQFGVKINSALHGSADNAFVVSVPDGPFGNIIANALKASPLVQSVEHDDTLALPELAAFAGSGHKVPALKKWGGNFSLPGPIGAWSAYLNQPAVGIIRLQDAQKAYGYGSGRVAVIDTGVDYTHPVLFPVTDFWMGYDFTRGNSLDVTGNSDLNQETTPMVDQETTPMVDSSGTIILNQETTPMVDQETTPMVDGGKLPSCFGHGTMVAGIIHLTAPGARILPIKAFASDGTGKISDIIKAIYYAVDMGATVINASFSTPDNSPELQKAMAYAAAHGVVFVTSVANNGSSAVVFPAGINPAIGVASTDVNDFRSTFSNYGSDVELGAPGEAIMTTFPKNHYALGWGTSFATPWVAGAVALIRGVRGSESIDAVTDDLQDGAHRANSPGLGAGRLDVLNSVYQVKH